MCPVERLHLAAVVNVDWDKWNKVMVMVVVGTFQKQRFLNVSHW